MFAACRAGPRMRVLLMPSPVPTHLAPMVPLAWACLAAGHHVLVSGRPNVIATAVGAGLPVVEYGSRYDELAPFADLRGGPSFRTVTATDARPSMAVMAQGWRDRVDPDVDAALAAARDWRPDLIVADPLEFGAHLVAAVLRVPLVCHRWGVDGTGVLLRRLASIALADTAARLGVPGPLTEPALLLDPCPPVLQAPELPAGAPVRFVPYAGGGQPPRWHREPTRTPRVCLSLGRVTPDLIDPADLRALLAALGDLDDVEVVVTVDDRHAARCGSPGPAVRLVPPVPLNLVLDRCDAVVHHGGSGTTLTAAAYGLPQVVLPFSHSLPVAGERVAASGAGIAVDGSDPDRVPAATAAAVRTVLATDGYRGAAQRIADLMAASPSPAAIVHVLENLV